MRVEALYLPIEDTFKEVFIYHGSFNVFVWMLEPNMPFGEYDPTRKGRYIPGKVLLLNREPPRDDERPREIYNYVRRIVKEGGNWRPSGKYMQASMLLSSEQEEELLQILFVRHSNTTVMIEETTRELAVIRAEHESRERAESEERNRREMSARVLQKSRIIKFIRKGKTKLHMEDARIAIKGDYALIEPCRGDRAAYLIDAAYALLPVIDLNDIPMERVCHLGRNIELIKEFESDGELRHP